MTCPCQGKGLVKICYKSGEAPHIAICTCLDGQWYRRTGLAAQRLNVDPSRVYLLEDLADPEDLERWGIRRPPTDHAEFLEAGTVQESRWK